MSKKEKIIAICFCFSFFLLISSTIYTAYLNKPSGYIFNIEKFFKNIKI